MKGSSTVRDDVASSYNLDVGGHFRALQTLVGASSAMRGCPHGGAGPGGCRGSGECGRSRSGHGLHLTIACSASARAVASVSMCGRPGGKNC